MSSQILSEWEDLAVEAQIAWGRSSSSNVELQNLAPKLKIGSNVI